MISSLRTTFVKSYGSKAYDNLFHTNLFRDRPSSGRPSVAASAIVVRKFPACLVGRKISMAFARSNSGERILQRRGYWPRPLQHTHRAPRDNQFQSDRSRLSDQVAK